MSVAVVTSVYGKHSRFVPAWLGAIRELDPAPDEIIVASDRPLSLPADVMSLFGKCNRRHPQAFYLNLALSAARTEWVWIVDVDDLAFPDALDGLEDVWADVWQMGYVSSAGESHVVPQMSADEFLEEPGNTFVAGSAIRVEAFREVGGFDDVAFQDWGLWRKMALAGLGFQSSGRTHFRYMRHEATRSATELTPDRREAHLAEMLGVQAVSV